METVTDKNGKKITVQYFGNLDEKLKFASGYIKMFNDVAMQQGKPQVDVDVAMKRIGKQHNKFYGMQSKYDGKGNLRNA